MEDQPVDEMLAELHLTADRERIARDLNYRVMARLHQLQAIVVGARTEPSLLAEAERAIDLTQQEIREAVVEWRAQTNPSSLVVALHRVVEDYVPLMKFTPSVEVVGPVSQIPPEIADDLLPVLREALSNVARHAAADSGAIELRADDAQVRLTVEDNGVGLPDRITENGLRHARRRAETVHGSLDVRPRQPHGTTFDWRVPLSRG